MNLTNTPNYKGNDEPTPSPKRLVHMEASCSQEKENKDNSPANCRIVVIELELLHTRACLSDDQSAYQELGVGIHEEQNNKE